MENTGKHSDNKLKTNNVKVNIKREFIGSQSLAEAFIPVIYEDIHRKLMDSRTIDNESDTI